MLDQDLLTEEKEIAEDILAQLVHFGKSRGDLIPILQMIQEKHAYLPPAAINW